jgi:small subunit ribosomal protein S3
MIERKLLAQKLKEYRVQEYITKQMSRVGHSHTKIQRTPLGDKIIITTSRPGLVVGSKGANIKRLTKELKEEFDLENPQIEINEVEHIYLDANIVAEIIVSALEKFGSARFKSIGHKALADVMAAGARGVEILVSGKVPSSRAKRWRFYNGYLKKCGDIAETSIRHAILNANLKSGIVGIKVSIMPPETKLTDDIKIYDEKKEIVEEPKEEPKKKAKKKPRRKRTAKPRAKKTEKKEERKGEAKRGRPKAETKKVEEPKVEKKEASKEIKEETQKPEPKKEAPKAEEAKKE